MERNEFLKSIKDDLNNLRNEILKKWITINESNKQKILSFLEKEWFKISDEVRNETWEFGITINKDWMVVKEGFFLRRLIIMR